jgi:hypothetical protein
MFARTLAGLAVGLGLAGPALAQQPAASLAKPVIDNQTLADSVARAVGHRGDLKVTAESGVITLAGTCPDADQKYAALTAARYVYGVKQVRDGISAPNPVQQAGANGRQPVPNIPPAALGSDAAAPAMAPAATLGRAPAAVPAPPSYAPPAAALYGDGCATGDCAQACSACDCLCGPPGRFWVGGEYLYWTAKGMSVPPLATTSPPGTPRSQAGVLGVPGTAVLFPESGKTNDDWRSGFRLRAGMWLDECQRFGLEGDFFFLGRSSEDFLAASDANGSPILARPFSNALANANASQLVAFNPAPASELVGFPGVLAGSVGVNATSDFIGGGFNVLCNHSCDPCGRLDYLVGFRYLNLRDSVTINENLTALAGSSVAPGTRFLIQDRFRTTNNFYGGNVGLAYERRFGSFFLGVRGSVGLGVTNSVTEISGNTTIVGPGGAAQNFAGGLLTQNTNIGRYSSNRFSVVPEVGLRVGAQVTERLRATVGYNFLYWSNVQRAGDQIDLAVNPNLIAPPTGPGFPARPAFVPRTTDYWVQGVSFGLEFRF